MEILQGDEWSFEQISLAFIRDICPEERKAEFQALVDAKDWPAIDAFMVPFHNIE